MNNWTETTLGDICESIKYGYTASASEEKVGPHFLRITDIVPPSINWEDVPYCQIDKNDYLKYRLEPGDIVIARTGATAGFGKLIRREIDAVFASYLVRFRVDPSVADSLYVGTIVESDIYKEYVKSQVTGSAQPQANAKVLGRFSLTLPPLSEQKTIAHILGSLDDKIELNRRMNETLEQMARAIFKSWFVDFDPVKAKAEGKEPTGMATETAKLFPDSFIDSELGKIPKAWKVRTVGDCFNLTMGQSPPGKTYNEDGEGVPFFQGRRDFGFRYPSLRVYCTAPMRFAEAGDTLVSVRAPVGDINMASQRCCVGRGVAAVRHKNGSRSYTYYTMHHLGNIFARFEAEGTVFGCITKKGFQNMKCVKPPDELVDAFESITHPVDEQIEVNENQSGTLAAIRDALLPKLLSGEIRVKDGEKFVEDI